MIEIELAKKFIEQITQYTDYNVNIMDDKGIIIASRDPSRVGTFHEVAYQIVRGREDIVSTASSADYPGVLPGINMVISIEGRREGAVGLTGDPEVIRPVALICKMAIEAMLKYEIQQRERKRHENQKERFVRMLTQKEFSDPEELRSAAGELCYSEGIVRIPILCRLSGAEAEQFLSLIKSDEKHSREDISFLLDESSVLLFKTMDMDQERMFADYKFAIADYLSSALRWLRGQGGTGRFYIGSFQKNFTQYYYGYRHCLWLEKSALSTAETVYFYDHSAEYLVRILPLNEIQQAYNVYDQCLPEEFKKNFTDTARALIRSNYNFTEAAAALYIHKNTLLYRYGKIKEILGINPMASAQDRFFMEALLVDLDGKNAG